MTAKLVFLATLTVSLVGTAAMALVARGPGCCDAPEVSDPAASITHMEALDDAIAARDAAKAVRAWHDVWGAALATRRWETFLTAGDQALRVGELTGSPGPARADATRAYQAALFHARAERSAEGVLSAAEAIALMGDREMADAARRLAHDLAARTADADVRK